MALYAIDTTIFSLLVREHPKVLSRLESLSDEDRVVLCTVVRGEILYGLARLPDGKRKRALTRKVDGVFASIPCEEVAPGAASHYAQIKREAEEKGTPLDENDLWIAAAALDTGATLATSDSDFQLSLPKTRKPLQYQHSRMTFSTVRVVGPCVNRPRR